MDKQTQIIVFTDLDGTFLDHNTYDYTAALPVVRRLQSLNVPIVPVTSKTLTELELLNLPFDPSIRIAENGMVRALNGVVHIPDKTYQDIIAFIAHLPDELHNHITGFHDMGIEDLMKHTGLDYNNAKAAQQRDASEPFLWTGSNADMSALKELATKQSFKITQGGRFYHVMSQGGKDQAISDILLSFGKHLPLSIALGDGPNDTEMLEAVDYGVIIPNPHGKTISIKNPKGKIIESPHPGPAGWATALNEILDEWEQTR